MNLAEALWRRGVDVSLRTLRKWVPNLRQTEEWAEIAKAVWEEENGRPWAPIVFLNQMSIMFGAEEEALRFALALLNEGKPIIPAIVAWRAEGLDPEALLVKPLERPRYLDSVENVPGFFLAVYKYEHGVDTDAVLDRVKEALGGERYVGEFLRLVDVDLPMGPDDFVRRVEQAVNVILKAREQGLSVGRIVEVWDALADGGGERLERLADAVRVVAEEEVRRRFWEEVRKAFEENGVHVFPDTPVDDIMEKAYYAGLIDIVDGNVTLTGLRDIISRLSMLLRTVRPIPMFRTREVEDALQRVAMDHKVLDVLERLPRRALKVYFETPLWPYVLEGIRKYEGDVTERLVDVLLEIEAGNIDRGEDVLRMLLAD